MYTCWNIVCQIKYYYVTNLETIIWTQTSYIIKLQIQVSHICFPVSNFKIWIKIGLDCVCVRACACARVYMRVYGFNVSKYWNNAYYFVNQVKHEQRVYACSRSSLMNVTFWLCYARKIYGM